MATDKEIEAAKNVLIDSGFDDGYLVPGDVIKAALEAAEAVRWEPIESAPRHKQLLLYAPAEKLVEPPFNAATDWRFHLSSAQDWCWATHFQLLPSPPESKNK